MIGAKRILLLFAFLALSGMSAQADPNPVPYLSIISPLRAPPGGASFALTVTGANFVSNSAVYWGSTALQTTYISRAKLTATVPAPLIANVGTGWITVTNPAPGGGTSNISFLQVSNAGGIFNPSVFPYSASGAYFYAHTQGDFNGDGKIDLVGSDYNGFVWVFLGNGDGTFQAPVSYADVYGAYGVAAGDINNDGKLDLLVSDVSSSNSFSVHLGNGDGTFMPSSTFGTGAAGYLPMLADMNGDGNLDVIIMNYSNSTIQYYQGNGDGSFQAPTTVGTLDGVPLSISIGDFDGDGILDVIAGNPTDTNVVLFRGVGDGTFQSGVTFTAQTTNTASATGDFNEDGWLDFLAAISNTSGSLFLNNMSAGFQASTAVSNGGDQAVAAADMNGDGHLDIIGSGAGAITISLGHGDGTFGAESTYNAGTYYGESITVGNYVSGGGLGLAAPNYDTGGIDVFLPTVSVSPSPLDFSSVAANSTPAAEALTITNNTPTTVTLSGEALSGANQTDFAISGSTCGATLAAAASCTASITFTPSAAGSRTATFTVTDSVIGGSQTAIVTGTGVVASAVHLTPVGLSFSYQVVATASVSQSVTLKNTGSAVLNFSGISVGGTNAADFGQTSTCGSSLAIGVTCTITVTFTPAATGSRSASISISDDALDTPQTIALTGTGVTDPVVLSSISLTFTGQLIGSTSAAQNVVLMNQNSNPLSIASIAISGTNSGDFSQVNNCGATIAAEASCTIAVRFAPTAQGARNAAVTISDSSAESPHMVSLAGTGQAVTTAITLSESPSSATFGQSVGLTATITPPPTGSSLGTVTFFNGATQIGTATPNSSGFATISLSSLPAGALSLTANYSGNTASGSSTSSVSTFTVNTTYAVTPAQTSYGVGQGGSVNVTVTVPPLGGAFDGLVTMSATGLPPGATATFVPPTVMPGSSGATTTLTIQLASSAIQLNRHENPRPTTLFDTLNRSRLWTVISLELGLVALALAASLLGKVIVSRRVLDGSLLAVAVFIGALLIGCTGTVKLPTSTTTTPTGSYLVTIVGTNGSSQISSQVTVVVQ